MFLGNGFSIDLIHRINKEDSIDLLNLFRRGDSVPWPADDVPGFLSQRYCPELWKLGARPNSNRELSVKIIEDIITCANVGAMFEMPTISGESSNVYIKAYHELVTYLRYLFIYYNDIVSEDELANCINDWGWAKLLQNLNNKKGVEEVVIVTYNYDIFLERVLKQMKISYQMVGFDDENEKMKILKPHGSISFITKRESSKERFSIKYNRDTLGGSLDMLTVDEKFDKISNLNTMIPPSGEANRYKSLWSNVLRAKVIELIGGCQEDDDVIFGGLSYCGVDRSEMDSVLVKMDRGVNITIINPDTNNTFGAVISSVFDKYIHYTNSEVIGGLYRD